MNPTDYRWLTDENIHPLVANHLISKGLDVWDVKQQLMNGTLDIDLLTLAYQEKRIIITHDVDFGNLVMNNQLPFYAIIRIKPGDIKAEPIIQVLETLFQTDLELQTPFILTVEHTTSKVKIRLRNFNTP